MKNTLYKIIEFLTPTLFIIYLGLVIIDEVFAPGLNSIVDFDLIFISLILSLIAYIVLGKNKSNKTVNDNKEKTVLFYIFNLLLATGIFIFVLSQVSVVSLIDIALALIISIASLIFLIEVN